MLGSYDLDACPQPAAAVWWNGLVANRGGVARLRTVAAGSGSTLAPLAALVLPVDRASIHNVPRREVLPARPPTTIYRPTARGRRIQEAL